MSTVSRYLPLAQCWIIGNGCCRHSKVFSDVLNDSKVNFIQFLVYSSISMIGRFMGMSLPCEEFHYRYCGIRELSDVVIKSLYDTLWICSVFL
jgi:hypothetical protein